MSRQAAVSFSHLAICTGDLERSLTFYTEGLGFVLAHAIEELGPPFDTLMELPGTTCSVRQLTCGEVMVELIGYPGSEVEGPAERRPMNRRGLTHITLKVDDIDAVAAQVVKYGGSVHEETRIDSAFGPILFCTDPDGVRIELIQPAG
jgi:predicted enzyme related to lactoylglutathione lyase